MGKTTWAFLLLASAAALPHHPVFRRPRFRSLRAHASMDSAEVAGLVKQEYKYAQEATQRDGKVFQAEVYDNCKCTGNPVSILNVAPSGTQCFPGFTFWKDSYLSLMSCSPGNIRLHIFSDPKCQIKTGVLDSSSPAVGDVVFPDPGKCGQTGLAGWQIYHCPSDYIIPETVDPAPDPAPEPKLLIVMDADQADVQPVLLNGQVNANSYPPAPPPYPLISALPNGQANAKRMVKPVMQYNDGAPPMMPALKVSVHAMETPIVERFEPTKADNAKEGSFLQTSSKAEPAAGAAGGNNVLAENDFLDPYAFVTPATVAMGAGQMQGTYMTPSTVARQIAQGGMMASSNMMPFGAAPNMAGAGPMNGPMNSMMYQSAGVQAPPPPLRPDNLPPPPYITPQPQPAMAAEGAAAAA